MGFEVAVAMMAVGTAVSAYGQYQAGKAQKRAYEYNAAIQEQNARIAQEQADYEARRQESRTRKMLARQRVAYAGSGFVSNAFSTSYLSQGCLKRKVSVVIDGAGRDHLRSCYPHWQAALRSPQR